MIFPKSIIHTQKHKQQLFPLFNLNARKQVHENASPMGIQQDTNLIKRKAKDKSWKGHGKVRECPLENLVQTPMDGY